MISRRDLRIVFAGTPEFAAAHLHTLIASGFSVVAVYSQPDRPSGRGKKLQPSAVKAVAMENNISVLQPLNFKSTDDVAALAALKPDVLVVVAYGLLLPKSVLDIPTFGCINVHASLLPRWRGAAPIERAIEAGDKTTGITIMQMDIGLDTGDMLSIKEIPITSTTTGDSLRNDLLAVGTTGLIETLDQLLQQQLNPVKQDNALANYASKLTKEEAQIDWSLAAHTLDKKIRAFTSSNVCYSTINGERIKIWQALPLSSSHNKTVGDILTVDKQSITVACGEGALQLKELQLPNGKRLPVSAILNGNQSLFSVGKSFA